MKKGFIIAFPTDTVYGIAARFDDLIGIKKINDLKQRSDEQKIAVLCDSIEMIESLAIVSDDARKLINEFMPGAFTIILKSKQEYFDITLEDTVGVRIPNRLLSTEIIRKYGPLKTTSINIHNAPPINDYKTIVALFGDKIDAIYEGEMKPNSIASTVIDFTKEEYIIHREGMITKKMIDEILDRR